MRAKSALLTQTNAGIYPAFPGVVTWYSNNTAGDYKRAAGMALEIGIGNFAGGEYYVFSVTR